MPSEAEEGPGSLQRGPPVATSVHCLRQRLDVAAGAENADVGAGSPWVSSYDLDDAVWARVDAAKRRWGPDAQVEIVAGTFVIVAADRQLALEQAVSLVQRAVDARRRGATKALHRSSKRLCFLHPARSIESPIGECLLSPRPSSAPA